MVPALAQKQTHRSTEQKRKPRNKAMHLRSINLWQRRQYYTMRKRQSLNNWCWKNWIVPCEKLQHYLIPYKKINSKWIKDLNVRPDRIKLLEDNIGRTCFDINHSNIFFYPSPRVMEIKAKINNWNIMKLKNIYTANHKQNKKTAHRMGENICKQWDWHGIRPQNLQTTQNHAT